MLNTEEAIAHYSGSNLVVALIQQCVNLRLVYIELIE